MLKIEVFTPIIIQHSVINIVSNHYCVSAGFSQHSSEINLSLRETPMNNALTPKDSFSINP